MRVAERDRGKAARGRPAKASSALEAERTTVTHLKPRLHPQTQSKQTAQAKNHHGARAPPPRTFKSRCTMLCLWR